MIKNGRLLFDKGIQEMQGQSLEEIFIKEGNRHEYMGKGAGYYLTRSKAS